jgi:hypothetical protein
LQFTDFQAMVNIALIAKREHRSVFDTHRTKYETNNPQYECNNNYHNNKPRNWQPNNRAPATVLALQHQPPCNLHGTSPIGTTTTRSCTLVAPYKNITKDQCMLQVRQAGPLHCAMPRQQWTKRQQLQRHQALPTYPRPPRHMAADKVHEMTGEELGVYTIATKITLSFIRV